MNRRPVRHLRWYVAALLCLASELNMLDRQVLSVLAGTIQQELGISTAEYAYVTSAFLASYTAMYAVGGRIVDRLGTRRSFLVFVAAWSVANVLHGFARSAAQLAAFRFLLGATEAANFPAGVRAVSEWFPMRERALAVGIFTAGAAVGSALAAPVASFLALAYGWQSAFVVTGALGFVWVAAWAALFRLPHEHPRLSPEERALITAGRDADEGAGAASAFPVPLRTLLGVRAVWGCVLVRALTDPVTYFLTFWVPKYLQEERGFDLAALGKYGWIPYVALALGSVGGGAAVRRLVGRGWTVDRARKRVMLAVSLGVPVCYLLVTRVASPALALLLLALLMFGHNAWGNVALPAEVLPTRVVATVTGIGGTVGGLVGIATQLGIGRVVERLSYAPVFAACAAVYLAAYFVVRRFVGELGVVQPLPVAPIAVGPVAAAPAA